MNKGPEKETKKNRYLFLTFFATVYVENADLYTKSGRW